ncbi:LysE family translocator [Ferrimonas balearica]|nr:LysE family translocator [Ferrimonas balearica]
MTMSASDLALYAGALFVLFMTPGPVWLAIVARTLSGGAASVWPLAVGVALGDMIWPLVAILGLGWIEGQAGNLLWIVRLLGAAMFVWIGIGILRRADARITADSRLTRPGRLAGFLAGLAAIAGNPKAILFYLGILPSFVDIGTVTVPDIAAILLVSMAVPFTGNLIFAGFVDRVRRLIASDRGMKRTNIVAGCLMICVGLILPFT